MGQVKSPPQQAPRPVWITCKTPGMDRQRIKTTDCATIIQRKPFTLLSWRFKLAAQLPASGAPPSALVGSTITPLYHSRGHLPCICRPLSEAQALPAFTSALALAKGIVSHQAIPSVVPGPLAQACISFCYEPITRHV